MSLPLTSLTAFEMLFDRLNITEAVHKGKNTLLMIADAGGVGSMAIQLARLMSDVEVVATASRAQSKEWALKMGAPHVIDHNQPLKEQLENIGITKIVYVFSTANSDGYLPQYVNIMAPQARLGLIDSLKIFNVSVLQGKNLSIHWESMFTRSLYHTDDMIRQSKILAHVTTLIDEDKIKPTANIVMSPIMLKIYEKHIT